MRALITWGSTRGGTEGISRMIGAELVAAGIRVELRAAAEIRGVDAFDVVIVGGALYAHRWHVDARRFVTRNLPGLRERPTWFFSSGPLDRTAETSEIPPIDEVAVLMARTGTLGHATFGGRLAPDATGLVAKAMAKTTSGDWRNPERIRAWARQIADALPAARPLAPIDPPGRSSVRLATYGIVAAAFCIALARWPLVAILASPIVYAAFADRYFRVRGARDPVSAAAAFAGILMVADLLVHVDVTWVAVPLAFVAVWIVGLVRTVILPLRLVHA